MVAHASFEGVPELCRIGQGLDFYEEVLRSPEKTAFVRAVCHKTPFLDKLAAHVAQLAKSQADQHDVAKVRARVAECEKEIRHYYPAQDLFKHARLMGMDPNDRSPLGTARRIVYPRARTNEATQQDYDRALKSACEHHNAPDPSVTADYEAWRRVQAGLQR